MAKPSKKSLISPEATTYLDCNEILDQLLYDLEINDEDIGIDIIEQLIANREAALEIMKECMDAELAYAYMNCAIGRGVLVGIIITVLGNVLTKREIELLEAQEPADEDY